MIVVDGHHDWLIVFTIIALLNIGVRKTISRHLHEFVCAMFVRVHNMQL